MAVSDHRECCAMIRAKSRLKILIGSEECGAESQVIEFILRLDHLASVLTELAYLLNTTYAIVSARETDLYILHRRSPFIVSDALTVYSWLHSAVHTGLSSSDKCAAWAWLTCTLHSCKFTRNPSSNHPTRILLLCCIHIYLATEILHYLHVMS
jgi:hypothetical protein